MTFFRRSVLLAQVALSLVLAAGPLAAARCTMRSYCPMMAQAAMHAGHAARAANAANAETTAHGDRALDCGGGTSLAAAMAAMDCCRPPAVTPPYSGPPSLSPQALVVLPSKAPIVAVTAAPDSFSRASTIHSLGLFTLHSVWRI
ncbi:MAG: hypothetical protein ABI639_01355 [Thermoanaerobaculia bacterium]